MTAAFMYIFLVILVVGVVPTLVYFFVKGEQEAKKMHKIDEAIQNGDTETLYRMLNRLENDGTINTSFGKSWIKV